MKIQSMNIHNFRSIKDVKIVLDDYSLLIGANNAGKTNLLTALRIFYEDGIKFDQKTDFPKFNTLDAESWIELEFKLSDDEFSNLKEEYKNSDNILRVRKYLKSSSDLVKANQSNIYAYENGELSNNLFYGAKNISQAKLGDIIYIPETATTDENLKLSGPSPLRNMITFVMKKVIKTSSSFQDLNDTFDEFNKNFRDEQSKDGFSIKGLVDNINACLSEWQIKFDLIINPIDSTGLIKNLVSHTVRDDVLNQDISIKNFGQGLQRHIIFTLLRLSTQYVEKKESTKKDFSPDFTLILFEEPEAFLHPSQQECLNKSLKELSSEDGNQILISTHSPVFVSRNTDDLLALTRIKRIFGETTIFQISKNVLDAIFNENSQLAQILKDKLDEPEVLESTKRRIRKVLGDTEDTQRMEEESIRYMLWLDSSRCSAFFAESVIIVEGPTEKVFLDYLIQNKWECIINKKVCIVNAIGKFNLHRFMNLFKELGIKHSVIMDSDENQTVHQYVNQFILSQKNDYTHGIHAFDKDIEGFLEISSPSGDRKDKKPLNIMWNYFQEKIKQEKIDELKKIVSNLIN